MHLDDDVTSTRADAMLCLVKAEQIGRGLCASDKAVLAMAFASAAAAMDRHAAEWRFHMRLPQ